MNNKNDKQELIKLIQENPNLPLVFMMSNDEVAGDYGSTVMENFTAYKTVVYKYKRWGDICFSDDASEVEEYYSNEFCDDEKYQDMSQKEFEKEMEKYVEENVEHYEAIVISVN